MEIDPLRERALENYLDGCFDYAKRFRERIKDKSTEALEEELSCVKPKGVLHILDLIRYASSPERIIRYTEICQVLNERKLGSVKEKS